MPSLASLPIWLAPLPAAPFIRVVPTPCRAARHKTPRMFNAARSGRRVAGCRSSRQTWFMTAPMLEVDDVRKQVLPRRHRRILAAR